MKKVVSSEEDTSDETDVCSDLSDSETPLFKKKAPPKKKSPSPKVKRARTCARDISASFSDASLTLEPNRGRETSRSREPSHSPAHSRFSEPVSSSKLIRPPHSFSPELIRSREPFVPPKSMVTSTNPREPFAPTNSVGANQAVILGSKPVEDPATAMVLFEPVSKHCSSETFFQKLDDSLNKMLQRHSEQLKELTQNFVTQKQEKEVATTGSTPPAPFFQDQVRAGANNFSGSAPFGWQSQSPYSHQPYLPSQYGHGATQYHGHSLNFNANQPASYLPPQYSQPPYSFPHPPQAQANPMQQIMDFLQQQTKKSPV